MELNLLMLKRWILICFGLLLMTRQRSTSNVSIFTYFILYKKIYNKDEKKDYRKSLHILLKKRTMYLYHILVYLLKESVI